MSEPSTNDGFDVLGLGCCAVDEILYVPTYPGADQRLKVPRRRVQLGGLTGAALIAAARLGARCAYAGCLGTDNASNYTSACLEREGVDVTHAPRIADARVIQSTIIVADDTGSRNIFYSCDGLIGAHPTLPSERVISQSKVLLIDNFGMEGNLRAVRIARANGVPIVADFEDHTDARFPEVLDAVDHLILSAEMAHRITGLNDPAAAANTVWHESRQVVIVTCGADGCWSRSADSSQTQHHPAFRVHAVDTTGCGDVFHGAYAAALAEGQPLPDRIRFAAAAAACKATRTDPPDRATVVNLIKSSPIGVSRHTHSN